MNLARLVPGIVQVFVWIDLFCSILHSCYRASLQISFL